VGAPAYPGTGYTNAATAFNLGAGPLQYTVTVNNAGPNAVTTGTQLNLSNTLPKGFTVTTATAAVTGSATATCSAAGTSCAITALPVRRTNRLHHQWVFPGQRNGSRSGYRQQLRMQLLPMRRRCQLCQRGTFDPNSLTDSKNVTVQRLVHLKLTLANICGNCDGCELSYAAWLQSQQFGPGHLHVHDSEHGSGYSNRRCSGQSGCASRHLSGTGSTVGLIRSDSVDNNKPGNCRDLSASKSSQQYLHGLHGCEYCAGDVSDIGVQRTVPKFATSGEQLYFACRLGGPWHYSSGHCPARRPGTTLHPRRWTPTGYPNAVDNNAAASQAGDNKGSAPATIYRTTHLKVTVATPTATATGRIIRNSLGTT